MSAFADVHPALIGHLKDLHLPTVRECYEDTARRAERETLSYEQYLLEVILRECEQRRKIPERTPSNNSTNYCRTAGPPLARKLTLSDYSFAGPPVKWLFMWCTYFT